MREKLLSYLKSLQENNLAFFAFRKSGEDEVIIRHQTDDYLHKTATDKLSYVVFEKYQNDDNHIFILNEVIKKFRLYTVASNTPLSDPAIPIHGEKQHVALVSRAIKALQKTGFKKVVLSRKQELAIQDTFESIYLKALDHYKTAHVYFFHHPQVGTWIGATPEILLSVKDDQLTTMSLAGTALYQDGVTHQWGNKEKEEQQIVTDYIKEQLHNSNCERIIASQAHTSKAGNLIHLKSVITAHLAARTTIAQVLENLHPTPAVCGLPTSTAQEFITTHENYDREYYTGYFGIVDKELKLADYYVNLRCMKLTNKMATLYVGGGITASSDAKAEYQETVEKLKTMGRLLT